MSLSSEPAPPDASSPAHRALLSLSAILSPAIPTTSNTVALLHDSELGAAVTSHLHHPDSGAGDDNICRWLYDSFQSSDPHLHLVVLRFIPTLAGVYLSRAASRKPLAGFEAVLLALYAHETKARGGHPKIVNIPNIDHPSLYHETIKSPGKNKAVDLHQAVLSPALEPYGNVRSTKRATIVGVALELYYSRIAEMPSSSKVEFCEFCVGWAGQDGCDEHNSTVVEDEEEGGREEKKGERVPLPWELFRPVARIVGHCLIGGSPVTELRKVALKAARCLYARAVHDVAPEAILATRGLLRLWRMADEKDEGKEEEELGALADLRPPVTIATLSL